jgi:chromosome partitioning protein
MKSIAFFNNKGGVGKTTILYHLAWMLSELGHKVIAVDLDPQANLSSMFLSDEKLYEAIEKKQSIITALDALIRGVGDIQPAYIEKIESNLHLIIGNLELSAFEDKLSRSWNDCLSKDELAFRRTSSFYRIIKHSAEELNADYVLVDVGPNLGALNRAALIAVDYIIIPVSADLFSIQGMTNLGKSINEWRKEWQEDRIYRNPDKTLELPRGNINPLGYIISQHGIRESRPVRAYTNWVNKIPEIYEKDVLFNQNIQPVSVENDKNCLGMLKHYRSLIPMAMEVNKPIFKLKPADGAIGAHMEGVSRAYSDFENLANNIIAKLRNLL